MYTTGRWACSKQSYGMHASAAQRVLHVLTHSLFVIIGASFTTDVRDNTTDGRTFTLVDERGVRIASASYARC